MHARTAAERGRSTLNALHSELRKTTRPGRTTTHARQIMRLVPASDA
jgi:hypothetical protein